MTLLGVWVPEVTLARGDGMAGDDPAKVATATERFTLELVDDIDRFDAGYRLLDAVFGPVNELERREVLEPWFVLGTRSPPEARVRARYHMVIARTRDGELAGVRDCFTALDPAARRVVVLMSHSLVLPAFRRSGLAALLRGTAVWAARHHAADAGIADPEILVVLEMEHITPTDPATMIRVLSYLRSGMKVIPPWHVPYVQPDFRDLAALGVPPRPLPFMLLVRQVGHEHRTTLTWSRMIGILDGLAAVHAPSVGEEQVALGRRAAMRYHDPTPGAEIPLLAPDTRDPAQLAPLLASAVRHHYPPEWVDGPASDVDEDRRALEAAMTTSRRITP